MIRSHARPRTTHRGDIVARQFDENGPTIWMRKCGQERRIFLAGRRLARPLISYSYLPPAKREGRLVFWLPTVRMPRVIRAAVEIDRFGQTLLERRRIAPETLGELR